MFNIFLVAGINPFKDNRACPRLPSSASQLTVRRVWNAGTPFNSACRLVRRHFGLLAIILPPFPQKPLGRRPKPKTARFAVGNAESFPHRPNAESPREQFGRLLEIGGFRSRATQRMPRRPLSGVMNGSTAASKGSAPSPASVLAFST